jgi:hypothetical protein
LPVGAAGPDEGLGGTSRIPRHADVQPAATILDKAGVPQEKVGDSTGLLTDL